MATPATLRHARSTLNYEIFQAELSPNTFWHIYLPKNVLRPGVEQFDSFMGKGKEPYKFTPKPTKSARSKDVCVDPNCGCKVAPTKRKKR